MISCIIPTRDRRRFIGAAIRSVLAQEGLDNGVEILVVDDGSKDHTREYVEAMFPEVRIVDAGGLGPGNARNIGVSEARGEVLMFLDSDDIWHRHHAQRLLWAMESTGHECAFGITKTIDLNGGQSFFIPQDGSKVKGLSSDALRYLGQWCFLVPSSFAITRAAFERVGGFSGEVPLGEDWIFFLRLSAHTPFAFSPEVITTRRLHSSSMCKQGISIKSLLRLMNALEGELKALGAWGEEMDILSKKRRQLILKEGKDWTSIQEWYLAMSKHGLIPKGL